MTIQNIEDVMDRIMSLNRNLTEESLRTLLSASGWEKDDIVEGVRIFKMRGGSSQTFSPTTVAPAPNFIKAEPRVENNYSFDIKKEEKPKELETEEKKEEDIVPVPKIEDEPVKVVISNKIAEEPKKVEKVDILEKEIEDDKPKKSISAKIFSVLLIIILIILGIAYFFPEIFGNFFLKKNNSQITTINTIQNNQYSNMNTVEATSTIVNPTSNNINNNLNSSTSLESLLKEISNLRNELNSYKEANQSSKTIVKYISQKGPTGKTGRGISSVTGTSTGFVINYTDNTSIIIPYSTTTIINILNSNSVCFRDMTSSTTQSSNDICLDRESVSKLIASSTLSH